MSKPRAAVSPKADTPRPRLLAAAALVTAATIVAYGNSFGVPFLFDDLPAIVENPSLRSLASAGQLFGSDQPGGLTTSGRPLLAFSLAVNHALGGYEVWGYHLINLAIHVAAALCLLGLVRRTLAAPQPATLSATGEGRFRETFRPFALPLAACIALVWTLHPLQTESVTYIVQRAESLAGFFYLLTLYAFARATLLSSAPMRRGWLATSAIACVLGAATKEVVVTAPLLVLLYDRTFVAGTFGAAWRARRGYYVALTASWLLLAAVVLGNDSRGGTAGFGTDVSPWSYALTQCGALVRYVALALWPSPLVFDYGQATAGGLVAVLPQALAVVATIVGTAIALRRWPAAGFLAATFFVVLAPSSSVLPIATQTIAEHRVYLALAAPVAALVLGGFAFAGPRSLAAWPLVALALGAATWARNRDYRSELSLWSDTVAKRPANARAHNNLGQALFRAGRVDDAIARYREALRLQPKYPEPHYNLGVAFLRRGDVPRAIGHYEAALALEPSYPEALNNLGNALLQAGRTDEARRRYEEAIARRPSFAEAHHNLGNALLQVGDAAGAIPRFRRALELDPGYAEAHYNLGNALATTGRMREAHEAFLAALALEPDYAEAQVNAGNAALALDRPREAVSHYERALALQPQLADAQFNLGSVLLQLERATDAIPRLEAALRLDPERVAAHRALGFALARTGRVADAISHYHAYLRAVPNDTEARQELAELTNRR